MNKIITLFVALIFATSTSEIYATNIPTYNRAESSKIRPRSLFEQPFYCAYQDGCVYLSFCRNIGQVEVTVTDMMSGESFTLTGNTFLYEWTIPVSDSESDYIIEVTTSSGYYYSTMLSY